MTSYVDNGYEVIKYFAKFEKFMPYSIIMPSFMTIGSQLPELDCGGGLFCPPPRYKIGSQNTPYKLGLSLTVNERTSTVFEHDDFLNLLGAIHHSENKNVM